MNKQLRKNIFELREHEKNDLILNPLKFWRVDNWNEQTLKTFDKQYI